MFIDGKFYGMDIFTGELLEVSGNDLVRILAHDQRATGLILDILADEYESASRLFKNPTQRVIDNVLTLANKSYLNKVEAMLDMKISTIQTLSEIINLNDDEHIYPPKTVVVYYCRMPREFEEGHNLEINLNEAYSVIMESEDEQLVGRFIEKAFDNIDEWSVFINKAREYSLTTLKAFKKIIRQ